MKNFFRRLTSKRFNKIRCMEMHNKFLCHVPLEFPSEDHEGGARKFFNMYHFTILLDMFDEDWEEKIILEEVVKKLNLIYDFDPKDHSNIIIVYKNHKKVYLPDGYYVPIPPRAVFVYDKSKLEVLY